MTGLAVIVPFKAAKQKSRLAAALDDTQRRRLSILMLEAVLAAVGGAGLAPACHVVSSDDEALRLARTAGGTPFPESENRGVNAAVSLGMKHARASRYLVLPADLPLLTASDLTRAMALSKQGADIVLSPSRLMDGTNLLLFSRRNEVPLSYDSNSFWTHLGAAASLGYSAAVYTGCGAVLDIDTVEDLALLAGARHGGEAAAFAREVSP